MGLDCEVEKASHVIIVAAAELSQYANKNLLETFKVPVLVDTSVDDA